MTEVDEVIEAHPPSLTISIVSLFPRLFDCWLEQGVVARAVERGVLRVNLVDLRPFGVGRHQVTDDYPFGGGAGMVMKPEPLFAAVESLDVPAQVPVILLGPIGRPFTQRVAEELTSHAELVLVAGHYEGVDERVREHLITDEISIGDYVVSSGELSAMVVSDAVARLVPGAIASESTLEESFTSGLLEYPQYTRPARFRDWSVPDVLLSGHHSRIASWRKERSLERTAARRPDLLEHAALSAEDQELIQNRQRDDSGGRQEQGAGDGGTR